MIQVGSRNGSDGSVIINICTDIVTMVLHVVCKYGDMGENKQYGLQASI